MDFKSSFLILGAFFLRIVLSQFGTLELDFNTFRAWSNQLVSNGFGSFYNSWSDYLPGYLYVLWLLGKISSALPSLPQVLLYKLPAILADIGTGIFIFYAVRHFREKWALPAAAIYLFNPAVLANSTLWGQVDSLTALASVTSIFFVRKNPMASALALGIGTLIKPQAAFIAPIIGILWLKNFGFRKTFMFFALCFVIFLLGFVPFAGNNSFLPFVSERILTTANQYPYTSVNAFNFWAILPGMWKPDSGGLQLVGVLLATIFLSIITLVYYLRMKNKSVKNEGFAVFLLSSLYLLISFLFLTRMHERHLLPVLAPLVVAAARFPILWTSYAILSITYLVNMYYSFVWINEDFKMIFSQDVVVISSLLNILTSVLIITVFLKARQASATPFSKTLGALLNVIHNFSQAPRLASLQTDTTNNKKRNYSSVATHFSKGLPALEKHAGKILTVILLFSFLSRVIFLNFPNTFYFDEVYHAFTAREMLRGNPAAWEWWNDPPEGFAYEWTHPPLAKLGMVGGMWFLGENQVGWRLPGALFSTATVFLVYLLGLQLFKSKTVGVLSSVVFALDGLPLVMSRIGMNDSYFLFFALGAILFFLKEKYFFSSILLGLAAASKWTAIWVLPILLFSMFIFRQKPRFRIFWFIIVPPLVYLASYIPFFTSGHALDQFIGLQKQMWWYHTGLEATHAYQSSAWTWPFNLRPVWLFVENGGDLIANIYVLGNPLIFWSGLVAIGAMGLTGFIRRQGILLFIVFSWGILFLPWIFSPRVMFLYHYLPAIPFLSLAIGWFLSQQNKKFVIISYCLITIAYCLFYPHWTGIFIPQWFDNLYYLIPSWK